jgi:hypothetical protein
MGNRGARPRRQSTKEIARLAGHSRFIQQRAGWRGFWEPLAVNVMKTIGRVALCLSMLALCSCAARADDSGAIWAKRRAQYPALMGIYDLAEGVPAPLRALALLRIAAAPGMKDVAWKMELLTEAFSAAGQEPMLWPTTYVMPAAGKLSAKAKRLESSDSDNRGLLRLTLQTEVVESMLTVDRAEAVSMFNQVAPLRVPVLTCSDGLIPDVKSYYQAATAISQSGFSAEQKKNGDPVQFLRTVVVAITSPVEIKPAATMLTGLGLSPDDTVSVVSDFASRLENLSGDDRSFFADLDGTSKAVLSLTGSLPDSLATSVLKAWRNYLIVNLTGDRCRETVDIKWHYFKSAIDVVNAFNARVAGHESVAQIDKDDVRPGNTASGSADDSPVQLSPAEQELQARWFSVEFGSQHDALSNEQKSDPEWIANFDKYLDDIADLKPSDGESEADALQHKCALMHSAIMAAPPGPPTDRVIAQYVQLLQLNNISLELISSWYSEVAGFLSSADVLNHARGVALRAMEASDTPALMLVAKLERLRDATEPAWR